MQRSDPNFSARQTIAGALSRIERRLRLNRSLYQGLLAGALALLVCIGISGLRWLGSDRPVAAALWVLLTVLACAALLGWLLAAAVRERTTPARAAAEADARAHLNDELTSACWFMQALPASEWAAAQLERAARTARGLEPARLVPLRIPAPMLGIAALGLGALGVLWGSAPLAPALALTAHANALSPAEQERVQALRVLAATLPDSDAARKLEQALQALERADASALERRAALAQAQDAVQQIRLNAASTRAALQRAADLLRGQPGMEAVAEALTRGDAGQAAELLGRMQEHAAQARAAGPSAPDPATGGAGDKPLEQALLEASEVSGPQPSPASPEAVRLAAERLSEIARELSAANYVNEAWEKVRGPQLDAAPRNALTASRFAEQTAGNSLPSPASSESPLAGGSMFRTAAVAEGKGRTEQEGGTRAGDALGEDPPDPLLGASGERLQTQLKQAALSGAAAPAQESDAWFYAESKEHKALAGWSSVQARDRFAQAQAGSNAGISIQHRQIVKEYFMDLREGGR